MVIVSRFRNVVGQNQLISIVIMIIIAFIQSHLECWAGLCASSSDPATFSDPLGATTSRGGDVCHNYLFLWQLQPLGSGFNTHIHNPNFGHFVIPKFLNMSVDCLANCV